MQTTENYTPGYTQNASDFMAQRSAQTHAAFLLPHLRESSRLLDCGCGPGSVTCDFARIVSSGQVTGIDREASQIERARSRAASQQLTNATFEVGSIYELPFPDSSFEVVFAHAVFEHLSAPDRALAEVRRVLAPGGLVALRSPDWGGFIVAPDTPGLQSAIRRYTEIQTASGGDVQVGRKFPGLLRAAGFTSLAFSATYECYQSPPVIGEYLALRLESADARAEAEALRNWGRHSDAIFAQAWCEILGSCNVSPAQPSLPAMSDGFSIRLAREHDIPALEVLIPLSVRVLQAPFYSSAQMEAALGPIFAVDRQLISDGTYFVVEHSGHVVGCGGWSRRRAVCGGDRARSAEDTVLDPAHDPARIRAFFVHPDWARRGIGRSILSACESALCAAGFRDVVLVATLAGEPLYASFGYTVAERYEHPLSNGLTLPAMRMVKCFNPNDPDASSHHDSNPKMQSKGH